MIIRSFLFLLAMLTGVSSAQAAGGAHLSPSSIRTLALSKAPQANSSSSHEDFKRVTVQHFTPTTPKLVVANSEHKCERQLAIQLQCTLRSDRARE